MPSRAEGSTRRVKVHVDTPNHFLYGGESLWAEDLGDGRYRIEDVPFAAYGLNRGDVVAVEGCDEERRPCVRRVLEPSGHRTLRVIFFAAATAEAKRRILDRLRELGTRYESIEDFYYAVDVPPDLDLARITAFLDTVHGGACEYETCEPRAESGFGDLAER